MKNPNIFSSKHEKKAILVSLLAAATALQLTSCAEHAPIAETTVITTEQKKEETSISATLAQPTETSAWITEPVSDTVTSAPMNTEPTETDRPVDEAPPAIRTENSEETITEPFIIIYEYSDQYYENERITKQKGVDGKILKTITTVYEGDLAVDTYVNEDVLQERIDEIVIIGTKARRSEKMITERDNEVPYETVYIYDETRYEDEKTVLTAGRNGYTTSEYLVVYENGKEISRTPVSSVVTAPVTEQIRVGTKPIYTETTETVKVNEIAYSTRYEYDDTLENGVRKLKTAGKNGYTEHVYTITYYKGTECDRVLVSSNVYEAVNEVILIGTKKEESYYMPFYDAANGGYDYPLTQDFSSSHRALDFGVWYGEPIVAIKSGTVIAAYDEGYYSTDNILWTYGTYVVIEHEDGMRSYYAHLKSRTVSIGDTVTGGEVIGYSGNTGRVSPTPTTSNPLAGTHLHFEIRVKTNGYYVTVDPKQYLPYWN